MKTQADARSDAVTDVHFRTTLGNTTMRLQPGPLDPKYWMSYVNPFTNEVVSTTISSAMFHSASKALRGQGVTQLAFHAFADRQWHDLCVRGFK